MRIKEQDRTAEEVADALGIGQSTVFYWLGRYRQESLVGLVDRIPDKPSTRGPDQRAELVEVICSTTPVDHGCDAPLWAKENIAGLVKARFRVSFTPTWIGQILRSAGLSPQRPLYKAWKQGPRAVEE